MVADNAAATQQALSQALRADAPPLETLDRVAPILLKMLLGERAVLLNRVAAGDPTAGLGRAIAAGGRDTVLPMIHQLLDRAGADDEAVEVYVSQLISDQQIRRVIGVMKEPDADHIAMRCAQAGRILRLLLKRE